MSDEERRTVLTSLEKYRGIWEEREKAMLTADRDSRMKTTSEDKIWASENAEPLKDEEDKYVEGKIREMEEAEEQPLQIEDDEHRNLLSNQ